MAGVNVMVADTTAEAEALFTSVLQRFHGIVTGRRAGLPEPEGDIASLMAKWSPAERQAVSEMTASRSSGTPDECARRTRRLRRGDRRRRGHRHLWRHDHEDRLRSYELLADAWS